MLLSMKWLNNYVDVSDIDIKDFCNAMTISGTKVEGYKFESEEINNVVVGKIISVDKHPNADRLLVCKVDVGATEPIQIVTAAQNVFEGAVVPVALHKSTIAGGVSIKKGKLRGVLSEGMFCSLKELNLTLNDFPDAIEDGILIINDECEIGQDIKIALGIDDVIVDFEITPNRADCYSVIGLAREVAAVFNRPLKYYNEKEYDERQLNENFIKVDVKNEDLCSRYIIKIVKDVKIEPSPRWMRERLRSSGVKPINNIVDITNYVMLEYGQPIHAFDYDKIANHHIIVRNATKGEKLELFDGSEKDLNEEILVIADDNKPLSVAGIMGGTNSGISDNTKSVAFEVASFSADFIRNASKNLAIRSESSSRFEKGVDEASIPIVVNRICKLICDLEAGKVEEGIIDINNTKEQKHKINLDYDFINKCLGLNLNKEEIKDILAKLYINVEEDIAVIPSWRLDVKEKADIVEEVARMYGYDKIESRKSNLAINDVASRTQKQKFDNKILDFMVSQGYYEVCTFSFVSPKYYDKINLDENNKLRNSVTILNPLGEDTSVMRTTAIPSMLEVIANNYNNQNLEGKFFEIAKEYFPSNDEENLAIENNKLIIGLYGKKYNFYGLKFIIENLFDYLNLEKCKFLAQNNEKTFHPGRCADVFVGDNKVGVIGQVHPKVINNYQMLSNVFVASLDISKMFEKRIYDYSYKPISKFPSVTRDISLICEKDLPVMIIENLIRQSAFNNLEEIKLVDVYEGYQVENNKKSVCYSLKLRSLDKTLTDDDIDVIMNNVLSKLKTIDVSIRQF